MLSASEGISSNYAILDIDSPTWMVTKIFACGKLISPSSQNFRVQVWLIRINEVWSEENLQTEIPFRLTSVGFEEVELSSLNGVALPRLFLDCVIDFVKSRYIRRMKDQEHETARQFRYFDRECSFYLGVSAWCEAADNTRFEGVQFRLQLEILHIKGPFPRSTTSSSFLKSRQY